MEIFLLPMLLTAGLLWWIFDDDDCNDDDKPDQPDQPGDKTVSLTQGDDTFVGTPANETVSALGGNDDVSGMGGNDHLKLAWGNDSGAGGLGNDTVSGGAGNDVLNGGAGNDVIQGGTGSDIVGSSSAAIDAFVQSGGKIWVSDAELAKAKGFVDRAGNSDAGDDTISGGDGNDFLTDTQGDNSMSGGIGMDFISALDKGEGAGQGVDTLDGGFGKDVLQGDDGDLMTGGAGIDAFQVIAAATAERAVEINDFEVGETVKITVEGAKDSDQLTLDKTGTDVKIMLGDRVLAVAHNIDTDAKLESLRSGITLTNNGSGIGAQATDGPDLYNGTEGNDVVDLLAGNDTAYGAGGNDALTMSAGSDVAAGEAGNDTLDGGTGIDLLNGGSGNDLVNGGADSDVLSKSSAYLTRFGADMGLTAAQLNELSSKITDAKFDDGGNDTLNGGAGNDLITDFAGDNLLNGGDGNDYLSTLDKGSAAGAGVDTLNGGAGNDWIQGDDGDVMTGGTGTDAFKVMYEESGDRAVTITDLEPGETIQLNVVGATQNTALSYAIVNGNAEISVLGTVIAKVNGISTPAQLQAVQAATTLVPVTA